MGEVQQKNASSCESVLFVGGPFDGQRRSVDREASFVTLPDYKPQVVVFSEPSALAGRVINHTYRRVVLKISRTPERVRWLCVMAHQSLADE